MKKIFILALMMLGTSVAFAAESEALKAVLKAKTYSEAAQLLHSSLSQLTGEEKAKAYNKLVDLASEKFEKEILTITANQTAEQLGKGKVEPYDTLGFYESAYNGLMAGLECDKYDNEPNEKGKVKPKFRELNVNRLQRLRTQLLNAGNWAAESSNNADMLKYWGAYVDSKDAPVFASLKGQEDQYLSQVAMLTSRVAYIVGDYAKANKYIDCALADEKLYNDALPIKLAINEKLLKSKEDTLSYLKEVEALYASNSSNDKLFSTLVQLYTNLGESAKSDKLIAEKLAAQPDNQLAWGLKGQNEMTKQDFENAIQSFKKADLNNVAVLTYLGYCINTKAAEAAAGVDSRSLYKESKEYLESARSLDPDRQFANWAYPLYQCYYNLFGESDARTREIENLISK